MHALVLENISKTFAQTRAVTGLSATVPKGIIQGFLGPNGAGKTTSLRMVMNILRPDSGRVLVFGQPLTSHIRSQIGYMPEERGLYPKMTVQNFLMYVGSIKGMTHRAAGAAIGEWLEKMGLGHCLKKRVEELSRGMQQKVQLISTVINHPALVILDEPFQGLDPLNLDLVQNLIREMRDDGATLILSTHMMDLAERLCDTFIVVNRGQIALNGTIDTLRSTFKMDSIVLEADGDLGFLASVAGVATVSGAGRGVEICLEEGGDPQAVLKAALERVRVKRFEIRVPSLHEIFVRRVGGEDA